MENEVFMEGYDPNEYIEVEEASSASASSSCDSDSSSSHSYDDSIELLRDFLSSNVANSENSSEYNSQDYSSSSYSLQLLEYQNNLLSSNVDDLSVTNITLILIFTALLTVITLHFGRSLF